jgi:hypothetical protein
LLGPALPPAAALYSRRERLVQHEALGGHQSGVGHVALFRGTPEAEGNENPLGEDLLAQLRAQGRGLVGAEGRRRLEGTKDKRNKRKKKTVPRSA